MPELELQPPTTDMPAAHSRRRRAPEPNAPLSGRWLTARAIPGVEMECAEIARAVGTSTMNISLTCNRALRKLAARPGRLQQFIELVEMRSQLRDRSGVHGRALVYRSRMVAPSALGESERSTEASA